MEETRGTAVERTEEKALALGMDKAIQGVWAIGLMGALIATLMLLRVVELVLWALVDIYQLAKLTREAARGIANNMEATSELSVLEAPAGGLRNSVAALVSAVVTLAQKLDALSAGRVRKGGY